MAVEKSTAYLKTPRHRAVLPPEGYHYLCYFKPPERNLPQPISRRRVTTRRVPLLMSPPGAVIVLLNLLFTLPISPFLAHTLHLPFVHTNNQRNMNRSAGCLGHARLLGMVGRLLLPHASLPLPCLCLLSTHMIRGTETRLLDAWITFNRLIRLAGC